MPHTLLSNCFAACFCTLFHICAFGQDTFSIAAADSTTREVGSAGASCVDLFTTSIADNSFLGDLLPNKGAINTQASYMVANQSNARNRMNAGDTPAQIIQWLRTNDAGFNPNIRQYGIVGFVGNQVNAAGFTGSNCLDYKNHITGSINGIYYSIQGNILSGQQVLDSMEARFRAEPGDLACKLMAALQGANTVGADTRCADNNTSSLFAFVKVSKPTDLYNRPSFSVSLRTRNGAQIEPIDSLQKLFNAKRSCRTTSIPSTLDKTLRLYPNPTTGTLVFEAPPTLLGTPYTITDMLGRPRQQGTVSTPSTRLDIADLPPGPYWLRMAQYQQYFLLIYDF